MLSYGIAITNEGIMPTTLLLRRYYLFLLLGGMIEVPFVLLADIDWGLGLDLSYSVYVFWLLPIVFFSAVGNLISVLWRMHHRYALGKHLCLGVIAWGIGMVASELPIRLAIALELWRVTFVSVYWELQISFLPFFIALVYIHNAYRYQALEMVQEMKSLPRAKKIE